MNLVSILNATSEYKNPSEITGGFSDKVGSGTIDFSPVNWVIIGVYLFAILCIGLYFFFETKFKKRIQATSQDFFMASKSIPGWAIGFSLFATSLSAITFLSVPSQTFGSDWIIMIGAIIAPIFAPFLIKFIVPFFRRLKAESAYDYIQKRFGLHLRLFISITFILYQTMRAAIVVYLPTIAISTVMPQANEYVIASIVILITIGYTYLGGIKSIIWADLIQGILLTAGILIMIFWSMGLIDTYSDLGNAATSGSGGFAASSAAANESGKFLAKGHWTMTLTGLSIPLVFMSYFVNAVYPLVGGQDVVQRYQAAKSKNDVNNSIVLNASLTVVVGIFMFYGFGTLAYQLFSSSNQVAYNVTPFTYNGDQISAIWVANNTAVKDVSSNMWGYVANKGFVNLMGSCQIMGGMNWQDMTVNMIKNLSMDYSLASGNGALVSINSIVSSYQDFNATHGVVSNSNIVPYFIATALPIGVSGFIIAGILAASQSAMGSCFNAASRCFVNDIIKLYYPNLSDKTKLVIGKLVVVVIGIFALLFTMVLIATKQDSIFLFFNSIVGLFGASTLAIFFIGMFDNYVRNRAAIIGMWSGVLVALATFLLSYAPFMGLFGSKPVLHNAWVAVFSFLTTYIVSYGAQYIENLCKYFGRPKLIGYFELTKLGKKLNASNTKIESWARFGFHGLLAKKCMFESNDVDNFQYATVDEGRITLNRLGTKLFNEGRLTEKKIIMLNRLGWGWFYIRYDVPRTDQEFYERMENNTLKDITENEKWINLGEDSWNWDVKAYRKYVKNLYKTKLRSSDVVKLEEKQLDFVEFQQKSSYDRYVLKTKITNFFRSKNMKKEIVTSEQLVNAQKMFEEFENA